MNVNGYSQFNDEPAGDGVSAKLNFTDPIHTGNN